MIESVLLLTAVIIAAALLFAKLEWDDSVDQYLVRESTDIYLPLRAVFDRWMVFECYPEFMADVQKVDQLGGNKLLWQAKVGGETVSWTVCVDEVIFDKRITWTSWSMPPNAVTVSFVRLSSRRTRVQVEMHSTYNDLPPDERVLRRMKTSMRQTLQNCKTMLENRETRTATRRG